MERFVHSHELPYKFVAPSPSRFWVAMTRPVRRLILRRIVRVRSVVFENLDTLRGLVGTHTRLLLAPNHSDHADAVAQFETADRVRALFCYMATHQLFADRWGMRSVLLPRCGVFPIDREGSALAALKAAREVLVETRHPLVVYPEGEVYHTSDRLTPLRDGAAAMALSSQKALGPEVPVTIVPVAMKYRFVDPESILPKLSEHLAELERPFGLSGNGGVPLTERLYELGERLLAQKEIQVLGAPASGPVERRVRELRETIVERTEQQRLGHAGSGELPERINALRRRCVELLKNPETPRAVIDACRVNLDDLFLAVQLFSYPGDYVRELPTIERIAETLMKFEEDATGQPRASPLGDRQLTIRIGEPIDARPFAAEKGRDAVSACTRKLHEHLQGALDALGPGTVVGAG